MCFLSSSYYIFLFSNLSHMNIQSTLKYRVIILCPKIYVTYHISKTFHKLNTGLTLRSIRLPEDETEKALLWKEPFFQYLNEFVTGEIRQFRIRLVYTVSFVSQISDVRRGR